MQTYDLAGFIATLRLLIAYAESGRLVAASINLEATGLGRYAYVLVDGTSELGDAEVETTAPTAPAKGQAPKP